MTGPPQVPGPPGLGRNGHRRRRDPGVAWRPWAARATGLTTRGRGGPSPPGADAVPPAHPGQRRGAGRPPSTMDPPLALRRRVGRRLMLPAGRLVPGVQMHAEDRGGWQDAGWVGGSNLCPLQMPARRRGPGGPPGVGRPDGRRDRLAQAARLCMRRRYRRQAPGFAVRYRSLSPPLDPKHRPPDRPWDFVSLLLRRRLLRDRPPDGAGRIWRRRRGGA